MVAKTSTAVDLLHRTVRSYGLMNSLSKQAPSFKNRRAPGGTKGGQTHEGWRLMAIVRTDL